MDIIELILAGLAGGTFVQLLVWANRKFATKKTIVVDEYSISLGPSTEFPTVLLGLKLDNGKLEGPFEFVPAFAFQLSDELCVATARAAKKSASGGE